MPSTTRLSLPYPAATDPADVPVDMQQLAEAIDNAAVYSQSTLATRPASGLADGHLFFATDTDELYLWDGTTWVPRGALPLVDAAPATPSLRTLGTGPNQAVGNSDARLSDQRVPTDESVTSAKIAPSLKPSGGAGGSTEALRALGTAAGEAAPGNHSRLVGEITGADITNGSLGFAELAAAVLEAFIPLGGQIPYGGVGDPNGSWMLCDGRPISRTAYSELFAVLGTAYGYGDGATTFNIPDKRGRVSVGADSMGTGRGDSGRLSGSTSRGTGGGEENHLITDLEIADIGCGEEQILDQSLGADLTIHEHTLEFGYLDVDKGGGGGSADLLRRTVSGGDGTIFRNTDQAVYKQDYAGGLQTQDYHIHQIAGIGPRVAR